MGTTAAVDISPAPAYRSSCDRIVAIKDGEVQPLMDATPEGSPSPSRSLLVERVELDGPGQQTHVLTDHVLALFLTPTMMRHARVGGPATDLRLAAGQFVICGRNNQESVSWHAPTSMLFVRVGDSALIGAARSLMKPSPVELQPTTQASDPRIVSLLFAVEAERSLAYPSGRLFLDSVEEALAALLVTSYCALEPATAMSKGGLAPHRLRRVIEFMHANIGTQISLEDLANCAGMSSSNFSHQFRASMNVSPYKYMMGLRIERSKELLRDRKLSILDVALAVGFESQQHFATVFRRTVGVTPSTYRYQF